MLDSKKLKMKRSLTYSFMLVHTVYCAKTVFVNTVLCMCEGRFRYLGMLPTLRITADFDCPAFDMNHDRIARNISGKLSQ